MKFGISTTNFRLKQVRSLYSVCDRLCTVCSLHVEHETRVMSLQYVQRLGGVHFLRTVDMTCCKSLKVFLPRHHMFLLDSTSLLSKTPNIIFLSAKFLPINPITTPFPSLFQFPKIHVSTPKMQPLEQMKAQGLFSNFKVYTLIVAVAI